MHALLHEPRVKPLLPIVGPFQNIPMDRHGAVEIDRRRSRHIFRPGLNASPET